MFPIFKHGTVLCAAMLAFLGPAVAHEFCSGPQSWGGWHILPRASVQMRRGGGLTIVAIGSSSTQGIGASNRAATYPAQLQAILERRFKDLEIEVFNRGIGGETVAGNLARFDRDVVGLAPALVIWQVGTNDALQGVPLAEVERGLREGVARARGVGADIVLMDPQPLLGDDRLGRLDEVREVIAKVAQDLDVPLLARYELMAFWASNGAFPADQLLGPDRLHMTDISYRCLAERVADLLPPADAPVIAKGNAALDIKSLVLEPSAQ